MKRRGRAVDGVLLLDKPYGVTSNAALQTCRRLLNAQKAGHTGTLDPLASGLLALTFGEATKFSADLLHADKTYIAGVKLGQKTNTGDLEGQFIESRPVNVTREDIEKVLEHFRGEIKQIPPMFSALKRGGKTLYDLAREGVSIEREPRSVRIEKLTILSFVDELLTIEVTCSKGTYIRVLAEDIGQALGCGAHLASLRRTAVGDLSIEDSITIEALERMNSQQRQDALKPLDALMQTLPAVDLSENDRERFCHGQRLAMGLQSCPRVRVYGPDGKMVGTARVNERGVLTSTRAIRNIAIIAHVDHGKTTLVDKLLRAAGTFRANQEVQERVMDSGDLERERGITILAKNCAVEYEGTHINIIDTPGHADFGGEVERVLSMVDGVLLLVDAVEGPMPQTRFVTRKALALGLKPIVVINKIDRPGARPDWVLNQTFDLFDKLGATEEQLDFPVIYCSALEGVAGFSDNIEDLKKVGNMRAIFDTVIEKVPVRDDDPDGPLQLQICSLDYSSYVGKIGIGRVHRGRIHAGQDVCIMNGPEDTPKKVKVNQILMFEGLDRKLVDSAEAGDIVLVNGIEELSIGTTITDLEKPEALPLLKVDEPTLSMNFQVNTSPLAGREGKYVTSRQIRERLERELKSNVAMRMKLTDDETVFEVCGRGELHLTILIENMRREGYELAVSRPRVLLKEIDGQKMEPYEVLTVDVEEEHQGAVMEELGRRRGDLQDMQPDGKGRVRLEYRIPARGLIGFQSEFMTMCRGTGIMSHVFDDYGPIKEGDVGERRNGVLISQDNGEAVAYALWKLQDRGRMFVKPGDKLYEGMIIGIHSRDNDIVVNPIRGKQLTNIRASGTDEAIRLVPPVQLTLESAVEFINDDELVEITPHTIRLRKRYLTEIDRRRHARAEREQNAG